jgi:pimeloyl-ACP methyl ester carboxylesterase
VFSTFTPSHRGGSGPPLVCLHGFLDTWRTWELVLPTLERHHDVLALTLGGHAGGPPIDGEISHAALADAVERAMDEAGFETAQIVGNSLGGYLALQLAERSRADTVVAFAPAGGWAPSDESYRHTLAFQAQLVETLTSAAPHADAILASADPRRRELLAHQMLGVASMKDALPMIDRALREGWDLDAERVTCPVRVVWGTEDELLPWPSAAARYRTDWLPHADWIELDGIGHSPQLEIPLETAQLILGFTSR